MQHLKQWEVMYIKREKSGASGWDYILSLVAETGLGDGADGSVFVVGKPLSGSQIEACGSAGRAIPKEVTNKGMNT